MSYVHADISLQRINLFRFGSCITYHAMPLTNFSKIARSLYFISTKKSQNITTAHGVFNGFSYEGKKANNVLKYNILLKLRLQT